MNQYDSPTSPASIVWSQTQHALIKNGGTWSIPRSGLILERTPTGFKLIDKMPWLPEMTARLEQDPEAKIPKDPAALLAWQREDFATIARSFKAGGLEVTDPNDLLDGGDLVIVIPPHE